MANYTVDNLQVEVATQSGKAVNGLRALTGALRELRDVTKISLPAKLSENIKAIGESTKGIDTNDITKLEKLGNSLQQLAGLGMSANGLKSFNNVLKEFAETSKKAISSKITESLTPIIDTVKTISEEEVARLERMSVALKGLSGMKGSLGISKSDMQGIKNISEVTEELSESTKDAEKNVDEIVKDIHDISFDVTKTREDLANILAGQAFSTQPFINGLRSTLDTVQAGLGRIKKLLESVVRVAFYRVIRTALKEITDSFSEGLKNAYAFSKQDISFTRLADVLDRIASTAGRMRNQLGAMLGEVLTALAPVIEKLIDKVTMAANYLTELFAAINGEDTYLQAQLTAKSWDEATDAAKKYKQQLLGIDEINNLTSQSASGSGNGVDVSDMFKEVKVGEQFKTIVSIKDTIARELDSLQSVATGLEIALGTILLFSGANIPLGLGLLAHGAYRGIKEIQENWDGIGDTIEGKLGTLEGIIGGFELGLGAVLAFSGVSLPIGISLILDGVKNLGLATKNIKWNSLSDKTQNKISEIEGFVGTAELGIGAILAFSGANIPLGIGLMISGATTWADKLATVDWEEVKKKITDNLTEIETAVGLAGLAIGAVLTFTGANIGLGIGMMIASGALVGEASDWSWNGLLTNLQGVFGTIKNWWQTTVNPAINKAIDKLKEFFGFGDEKIDKIVASPELPRISAEDKTKMDTLVNGSASDKLALSKQIKQDIDVKLITNEKETPWIKQVIQDTKDDAKRFFTDISYDFERSALGEIWHSVVGKASGGFVNEGTLFYAGESGPEFVGSMGGQTAVANTDQMGDAIRQASYEGMAQALREYGGTVVLSPDTDKIFNVVKQKGQEYTRRTGESWAY